MEYYILMNKLPEELKEHYQKNRELIKKRLNEFSVIAEEEYFYELCYCICTPQSSAKNAEKVQKKLIEMDFLSNDFNPVDLLSNREHYIRFHNQKAERLVEAKKKYSVVLDILNLSICPKEKREKIVGIIKGIGYKEASHFLRNIGYRDLAIIDRHLLKNLLKCGVIESMPKSINKAKYLEIEEKFKIYAEKVNMSIDELDLLFWSFETGMILK
ncbi:MAG TPA: N-glycosylase/DNA lyase [Candidatus Kapabacteria bacterium]|nr:N-glycosylase/DNA lyase [Candidatus Kapabacteria bacterium]